MAMIKIQDIAFEIDGDLVNIEQDAGCGEVHYVQLHRLHLQHLAEKMGMVAESQLNAFIECRLKSELLDLHSGMKWLYGYLDGVPSFPPQADESDDVVQARWVLKKIEDICKLAGVEIENADRSQNSTGAETATARESCI